MALFHVALLHVAMFSFCIYLLLHSSQVAAFSCCTLFMLHYFQRCNQDPRKHLRWGASQQLTKPLNTVAKLSIADVRRVLATRLLFPCCTFFMWRLFHVALFSCCTFFMWHLFHVALFSYCIFSHVARFPCRNCTFLILKKIENKQETENTTQKRPYTQHRELVSILFWYPITHFCHYIIWNGWYSEKEPICSLVGKEYVCQGLKLLKLECELKFISPRNKLSCR